MREDKTYEGQLIRDLKNGTITMGKFYHQKMVLTRIACEPHRIDPLADVLEKIVESNDLPIYISRISGFGRPELRIEPKTFLKGDDAKYFLEKYVEYMKLHRVVNVNLQE